MPEPELTLLFTRRLNALGARYMVSGSVAASIYGTPRLTNDVDIVVVLGRAEIARLPEVFPETGFYCPPLEAIAEEAAREGRGHWEKHLGDIRSMLALSPDAIDHVELDRLIAGRGLQEAWRQVLKLA